MTISPIEAAQRTAVRGVGFAYLSRFATVVYINFGIHEQLIVENNAAETARNYPGARTTLSNRHRQRSH
jgi:hypothetical protein